MVGSGFVGWFSERLDLRVGSVKYLLCWLGDWKIRFMDWFGERLFFGYVDWLSER